MGSSALMLAVKVNSGLERLDADAIEMAKATPEQASHAMASCLPFVRLKFLSVTPTGADYPLTEQQEHLLLCFGANEP